MEHGPDVLRGTIDLLILRALRLGPNHGWGLSQSLQQLSAGALEVNQGSLYPALQRLEYRGLIVGEWGTTEQGRRARYYNLTPTGRKSAKEATEGWRRHVTAIELIITAT
jgi:PadR family transcriptional regulator, regulatory protein PadR